MALDRIASFIGDHPTTAELRKAAIRYLDGAGSIEDRDGFFVCFLPGGVSRMFRESVDEGIRRRGFEVHRVETDELFVNIATRQADEFTSAVANGFFAAIVRRWEMRKAPDAP